MKKQIIILFMLSFYFMASSQVVMDVAWQKSLGGSNEDIAFSACNTEDGGYFILGYSYSSDGHMIGNHGLSDFWAIKYNEDGSFAQIPLGGSGNDEGHDVKQTTDGGYILVGGSSSNDGQVSGNHGGTDVWVVRLDPNGNIAWQKSLGGSSHEKAYAVELTADGGYLIGATTESIDGDISANHGQSDVWLVKLNATGDIEWDRSYGGTDYEVCYSLIGTDDGGFILAGSTMSNDGDVQGNHGNNDYWVLKIDSNGDIEWQNCLGGSGDEEAWDIIQSSDGYYYVLGYSPSNDGDVIGQHQIGTNDMWLVKLASNGDLIWSQCYGGTDYEFGFGLVEYLGNIVLAGSASSVNGDLSLHIGAIDVWVVSVNTDGEIVWEKSLGGLEYDQANGILSTELGLLVYGFSMSDDGHVTENFGGQDYWLVKLEWFESVNEEDNFNVQLFPNPVTAGKLHIQSKGNTHFELISVRGSILIVEDLEAPSQTIDISHFPSGMYFARFISEQGTYIEKILIE